MEYYLQSQIPSSNCVCVCLCVSCKLWHTVCGLPVCVLDADVRVNNVHELLLGITAAKVSEKCQIHLLNVIGR